MLMIIIATLLMSLLVTFGIRVYQIRTYGPELVSERMAWALFAGVIWPITGPFVILFFTFVAIVAVFETAANKLGTL